MAEYREIAAGRDRTFSITGGLTGGDTGAAQHTLREVLALHGAWQRARGVVLGATLSPTTISYAWLPEPLVDALTPVDEPGFILSGSINVFYDRNVGDDILADRVRDLAAYLADHLGQARISYSYDGRSHILERARTQAAREEARGR